MLHSKQRRQHLGPCACISKSHHFYAACVYASAGVYAGLNVAMAAETINERLLNACANGEVEKAKSLVEQGASVNHQSEVHTLLPSTPLPPLIPPLLLLPSAREKERERNEREIVGGKRAA